MASWKTSVATLTAFFERESRQEDVRDTRKANEREPVKSPKIQPGSVNHNSSSLGTDATAEFEPIVQDVWCDLLRYARNSQSTVDMGSVFSAAGENLKKKKLSNVAEEVYRRELIAVLEAVSSRPGKKGDENSVISGEQAAQNSMKRRLSEVSEEVRSVKEALHFANKEKLDLEYICAEHEERRMKLVWLLREAKQENKGLRSKNNSLVQAKKKLESEVERMQAEKSAGDVERLKALHKAEMAQLMATQVSLHSKRLDEQLKRAESSSIMVHKHVDELEKAVEQMTTILTNRVNSSEPRRPHWFEGQVGSLVHRSSKAVGRFKAKLSRDRNDEDEGSRGGEENNSEETERGANTHPEECSAPQIGKRRSLGFFFSSTNRERGQTQQGLLHRITSRLRRDGSGQGNETEARGSMDGTVNHNHGNERIRREASTNDVRDADGPTSPRWKMGGLKRILSGGVRGDRRSEEQANDSPAVEYISRTLETLEKNLETLQDVYEFKDEEVHRLNRQLGDAIKLSDAFEKGMRSEFYKRLEVEQTLAATGTKCTGKKSSLGDGNGRESIVRDKVAVRGSCRWF